jgi:hypothetical protein
MAVLDPTVLEWRQQSTNCRLSCSFGNRSTLRLQQTRDWAVVLSAAKPEEVRLKGCSGKSLLVGEAHPRPRQAGRDDPVKTAPRLISAAPMS